MSTHILLIEDEDVIRKLIERALVKAGYDVTCASDGTDGVESFRRVRPPLVITDIVMPEKDGIDVILEVRRSLPSTKIIAMSGGGTFGRTDILGVALRLGADRALMKPFSLDDLLAAVHQTLGPTGPADGGAPRHPGGSR